MKKARSMKEAMSQESSVKVRIKTQDKKHRKAIQVVTAWRILKADGLLTKEESNTVSKRIAEKYSKELSPLR